MIFNPVVDFLETKIISRTLSVLLVFAATALLIFAAVSFLLPKLISQFNTISLSLNEENIRNSIGQIEHVIKNKFPFLSSVNFSEKISTLLNEALLGGLTNVNNLIYSLFSFIAIMVIVPFLSFFLLKDSKRLFKGIINIMPNKYFEFSYSLIKKISFQLSRFIRGWLLDAFIVGLLSSIGLSLLGINNSISIGFVAGIGHLIPYFGPLIGGVPAIIISIIQFGNLSMLPSVALMFVIIYTLDNGFIQPNIFSKSTDMHPLVIIVLIMIGSQLMGILGMLLAVPIATIVKTAAREFYFGYKNYKIIHS